MMEREPISDRTELQTQLLVAAYSGLIYPFFQERSLWYKMTKEEKSKWNSLFPPNPTDIHEIMNYQYQASLIDKQLAGSPYQEVLAKIVNHSLFSSSAYHECFTLEKDGQFFKAHHSLKNPAKEILGGYFFSFKIPPNFFAPEFFCEYQGITFLTIEPGKSSDYFTSLNASDKKSLLSAIGAKVLRSPQWTMRRIKSKESSFKSFGTGEPEILEATENWAICLVGPDYESDPTKVAYRFQPPLIVFHQGEQFHFQNSSNINRVPSLELTFAKWT